MPEMPKITSGKNAFCTELIAAQNKLVSSANWLILTSFPNKLIPLKRLFSQILAAKISSLKSNLTKNKIQSYWT